MIQNTQFFAASFCAQKFLRGNHNSQITIPSNSLIKILQELLIKKDFKDSLLLSII